LWLKGENMKKNKTVGIIGGLGPETTAHFYLEVVFACSKISGRRPQILISNVAMPLKIEKEIITEARNERSILPFLIHSAKQLENGGADFIVIPCNTVHIFIDEIRNSVKIPVLSIIEETSSFLRKEKIKEVGLLATTATIKNKLFDESLKQNGIRMKTPNNTNQLRMGKIIHHLVKGEKDKKDKKEFLGIIKKLNINDAVLACTDLQLLNVKHKKIRIFDTMEILAKATVSEMFRPATL
jgi:aspartate racemase